MAEYETGVEGKGRMEPRKGLKEGEGRAVLRRQREMISMGEEGGQRE